LEAGGNRINATSLQLHSFYYQGSRAGDSSLTRSNFFFRDEQTRGCYLFPEARTSSTSLTFWARSGAYCQDCTVHT